MPSVVILSDQKTTRLALARLAADLAPDIRAQQFKKPADALVSLRAETPDLVIADLVIDDLGGGEGGGAGPGYP